MGNPFFSSLGEPFLPSLIRSLPKKKKKNTRRMYIRNEDRAWRPIAPRITVSAMDQKVGDGVYVQAYLYANISAHLPIIDKHRHLRVKMIHPHSTLSSDEKNCCQ
ncbi:hypothetical protein KP509_21G047200 [Ceratopteris richardii]|uniref:Uncharacterized protein n=1 Tax=Ceratopteris richardii TaxID=49495 RepID=A0A8T2S9K2_CERRI|nr:hypothetical protein KP509_21G047200 [Ceratopteris richardii]